MIASALRTPARLAALLFVCILCIALAPVAFAQDPNVCDEPGEVPDLIVGDLDGVQRFGTVGISPATPSGPSPAT